MTYSKVHHHFGRLTYEKKVSITGDTVNQKGLTAIQIIHSVGLKFKFRQYSCRRPDERIKSYTIRAVFAVSVKVYRRIFPTKVAEERNCDGMRSNTGADRIVSHTKQDHEIDDRIAS